MGQQAGEVALEADGAEGCVGGVVEGGEGGVGLEGLDELLGYGRGGGASFG